MFTKTNNAEDKRFYLSIMTPSLFKDNCTCTDHIYKITIPSLNLIAKNKNEEIYVV